MLRRFWRSETGPRARRLFAALLGLLVAINGLNVLNSYVGRDFMTSLEQRRVPEFLRFAVFYVGVFALSTLAEALLRYTEETFALTWRVWLSRWTVRHYLQPPVYHRLSDRLIADGDLPNPDERIADDIRAFTTVTLSLLILSLNATFTILAFSGVLWSISPPLFAVAVLYALAGSFLAVFQGRPLVRLTGAQLDREANFRAELLHVREHAGAIAVAGREDRLLRRLLDRIDAWSDNLRRTIRINLQLGLVVTGYRYLIQILPTLIVAPSFIRGDVEFGVVTQSAMAFAQLVGAFSLVVNQIQPLSSYAAVISRLGMLDQAIERAHSGPVLPTEVCAHHRRTDSCADCAGRNAPASAVDVVQDTTLGFDRLTLLSTSDGRPLVKELYGTVKPGARLLVSGPSDAAATALFRAAAGLGTPGSGRLRRPPRDGVAFLGERPYLPPGTLREAVSAGVPVSDPQLQRALSDVDLNGAAARVGGPDVERRWESVLSLGEQQRAAAAHARMTRPGWVFLERPGTALDPPSLKRLLELFAADGAAVVMIGRRGDAPDFFTSELALAEDGSWAWHGLDFRDAPPAS